MPICENCNEDKKDISNETYYYPDERKHKHICGKCWEDLLTSNINSRIQKEKSEKHIKKRKQKDLIQWVEHLKKKHHISQIKLFNSFDILRAKYNKEKNIHSFILGFDCYTPEFKELCKKFCMELDSKLHYLPYAMLDKCDNFDSEKDKCNWCKSYYPNCYEFLPNIRFEKYMKYKYSKKEIENKKQTKLYSLDNVEIITIKEHIPRHKRLNPEIKFKDSDNIE